MSVLNPNHYSQNIRLIIIILHFVKYAWKILNGCLIQWCYFFVHMLRYFAGLSMFCFPKTNPSIQRFRTFQSFILSWHQLWWIHHECLLFSVDKCQLTAKVCSTSKVVCFLIRPFVSILLQDCKLFKLQLKISVRRKLIVIHCKF